MNSVTLIDSGTMTRIVGFRPLANGNAVMNAKNGVSIGAITHFFGLAR
jgi:hypothetical protein